MHEGAVTFSVTSEQQLITRLFTGLSVPIK